MKGRAIAYSREELAFIKSHRRMGRRRLHAAFVKRFRRHGITVDHIKSLCTRRGWGTDRQYRRWRPEEDVLLRELYADTPSSVIARRLRATLGSVYQRAQALGLRKSTACIAQEAARNARRRDHGGRATRFKKGHVSPNKGLRRPGWGPGRMKETQFRKGERRGIAVDLYKPIGTERVSKNGYLERKIHDGWPLQSRWKFVQHIRWEALHGPVPRGMVLKCLGDKLNTDPSNWELVPRGLLPRLNGIHGHAFDRAPAELKPTIMAIAKLEHAAMTRRREPAPSGSGHTDSPPLRRTGT